MVDLKELGRSPLRFLNIRPLKHVNARRAKQLRAKPGLSEAKTIVLQSGGACGVVWRGRAPPRTGPGARLGEAQIHRTKSCVECNAAQETPHLEEPGEAGRGKMWCCM